MISASSTWTEPDRTPGADAPPLLIWHLRLGDLGDAPLDTLRRLTVPSEHARAQRYRFDADRHRHLAGRGLIRLFAAERYDCDPQAPSIQEGPHGKPHFEDSLGEGSPVEFNIAHSDDVVVAAFSRTHPVGIDVELLDRDADLEALAQRVFTDAEQRRLQTLSNGDWPHFFFQVWTCKEAFLKATGLGLQRAPHTVECIIDGDTIEGLRDAPNEQSSSKTDAAARWDVRSFSVSDRIVGAVVRDQRLPTPLPIADAGRLVTQFAHQ